MQQWQKVLYFIFPLMMTAWQVQAAVTVFPKTFKWCVSTSAHQIEGNNLHSDWWAWEQIPGHIQNNERSGLATDHWHHVAEDIALMQDLHVQQYRMSIEWAKVQPSETTWDASVLQHYRNEILQLHAHGIQPFVTLHHFTLPQWVAAKGGLAWDGFAPAFAKYVQAVNEAVGSQVQDWVTFNEPMVVLFAGYLAAQFPPQLQISLQELQTPWVHLLQAHAHAYHLLHMQASLSHRQVRVGIAHHLRIFDPARRLNPLDELMAHFSDMVFNWALPEAVQTGRLSVNVPFLVSIDQEIPGLRGSQDFFGLNYYSRDKIEFFFKPPYYSVQAPTNVPTSDLGWEIYPEGMHTLLQQIHQRYKELPILITENGIADSKDEKRPQFLIDHLQQVGLALQEGIPVESYCHWSLMDNFEWASGFTPRFGLYAVDYATLKRIPRKSALLYSQIARDFQVSTDSK